MEFSHTRAKCITINYQCENSMLIDNKARRLRVCKVALASQSTAKSYEDRNITSAEGSLLSAGRNSGGPCGSHRRLRNESSQRCSFIGQVNLMSFWIVPLLQQLFRPAHQT